jgi:hypothetical protein
MRSGVVCEVAIFSFGGRPGGASTDIAPATRLTRRVDIRAEGGTPSLSDFLPNPECCVKRIV